MITKTVKKLSVAILALVFTAALVFGAIGLFPTSAKADGAKAPEEVFDLTKGPNDSIGQPNADAAGNLLKFRFQGVNLSDGSFMEDAVVSDGVKIGDLILVDNGTANKTVSQWVTDSGTRPFRIAVYGPGMYLQFENGVINRDDVKYVTFKAGFMLFEGTAGTAGDWVFTKTASTKVDGTEIASDIKFYVNRAGNTYDYATDSLAVKSAPTKTVYEIGETFDPAGMVLEATTVTSGTKAINVTSGMCSSVDLSTAGKKTVTVSYGGKTVTQEITVKAAEKTLTSIAFRSGSVSIEQNGSIGEMTVSDLKITATYEGGESEEVDVTTDMISVDPANVGVVKGKIAYTVGTQTKTCEVDVTVTERTTKFDATNIYPIPLDGYYTGEDGGTRVLEDSGINIWFTTNAGFGEEKAYDGLGEKWYDGNEDIHKIIKAHVLINGKTFDELNAEGAGLARFLIGWYGDGVFTLRIHTDGSFRAANVETITLLKGFQMYNTSFQPLGVPTPCDYTVEACAKPGTSDKMLVRKTESIEIVSAPTKTEYYTDEKFDVTGMTIKAVYTDGGYAIIPVKDRMVSCDLTAVSDASPVTVTYNGKTVTTNVKTSVRPATLTSIAVKDGGKLFLKQYSRTMRLTPDAKLVLTYSDNTTEEVELTLDMISGYTNETVGDGKATVTHNEKTCEITYTVSEYDGTSTLNGIEYGLVEKPDKLDGISIEFKRTDDDGLKALWNTDKAVSAVFGKTNGDFVTINGETVTSLVAAKKVARMWVYGKRLGFHIDDAEFMATVKNGAEICFLPGFAWSKNANDAWGANDKYGEYSIIENAVVTKPMYFCFKNGISNKVLDTITLKGEPKNTYYKDDVINVSGLSLEVVYKGFEKETVEVTAAMCEYDFSTAGEKTVTVNYEGKSVSFTVTVSDVKLTGIEIVSEPTKKEYDFGIENELNTEGLVVKAVYDNNEKTDIDVSSLTFEGFDSRSFGTQTITVKYGEFSETFEITVADVSKNKYLSIDYDSGAASYEDTQHNSLVISFMLNGVYEDLGSFWGTNNHAYVADYMLINGVKVSELIEQGKVTRLCTWASQIVIHLDTCELVPATWVDKRANPDDPNDTGMHYIEGVSEVVETVTFLPGFQWYTTSGSANWGNSAFNKATLVEGAVLKEKVELTNLDGYGWRRELKKDENGEVAKDALTVVSQPNKTVYKVGEPLKLDGMEVLAKYADGGEVIINPNYSQTKGFDRNKVGEQTITYTYNGVTVSFTVTVVEEDTGSSDSGNDDSGSSAENPTESSDGSTSESKGCLGSIGVSGAAVIGLFAVAAICFKKKKEDL